MNIPKPKYNVGDKVNVRNEEGPEPEFPATVLGVWWDRQYKHHEYSVIEDNDGCSDGYTDEWLSPLNAGGMAAGADDPPMTGERKA